MTWTGPESAALVKVPDVLGLEVAVAQKTAWAAGVVLTSGDPDGPALRTLTWPGVWIVTAQSLPPGSPMRYRGSMAVEFRAGGPGDPAGDREPRSPKPIPNSGNVAAEPERRAAIPGSHRAEPPPGH